ncbi:MAG: tyrosine-type recombinase/integrase [Alphaproteobacteria bacterium]|nr:tyrosine-type recombinase/integrase [Alphaproteobacteria bacterium]
MRKHHPENERVKRRYFLYLREAKRLSEATVDQTAAAIAAFEESTGYKDFRRFRIEQAQRFKRVLAEQVNPATGKPLAKATIHSRLMALRSFFQWLCGQPGFRSRLCYSDADYFNPSANDGRIAKATRERSAPLMEQIRHVLQTMPAETEIQRRNRALIAFTILTGARDSAIASLSLKHVDLAYKKVDQDAREVRTKRAKTITCFFFPVGQDIEDIVIGWINWLKTEKLFGPDDPLFPATRVALDGNRQFAAVGLDRTHWRDSAPIRRIFKQAFESAGLPYFNPHLFRKTLALLGERLCTTPESFKAWSQNLGHDQVLTTFTSYGAVSTYRQAEILARLGEGEATPTVDENTLQELAVLVRRLVQDGSNTGY